MKSEAEIRAHMHSLSVARHMPCECRNGPHEAKCVTGGLMMMASIHALAWALGENEAMQSLVDRMARDVREYIASG